MKIIAENYFACGDANIRLNLTEDEAKTLAAAGRAAGLLRLEDVLANLINEAIDIGCRAMREESDKREELAGIIAALGFDSQAA